MIFVHHFRFSAKYVNAIVSFVVAVQWIERDLVMNAFKLHHTTLVLNKSNNVQVCRAHITCRTGFKICN